jgi:hypothetical protein
MLLKFPVVALVRSNREFVGSSRALKPTDPYDRARGEARRRPRRR